MKSLTDEVKKERGWYYIGHDKIYWRNCDSCGTEYQGMGRNFCSRKCSANLKLVEKVDGTVSIELKQRRAGSFHPNKLAVNAKKISDGKRGKPNPKLSGALHHNWRGGVSFINKTERQVKMVRADYKNWRRMVFERDNFVCKICGSSKIEAHHIYRWAEYPEKRYDIDNGITVCKLHHPIKKCDELKMVKEFIRLINMA